MDNKDSAVCPCCFQLTGHGSIYNISNGVVAKDSTAISNATTLGTTYTTIKGKTVRVNKSSDPSSFTGLIGCAEALNKGTPESTTTCVADASNCYVGSSPATLFQGPCAVSGSGIEAGWTFSVGGPAFAMAVPEQGDKAGLIIREVVSEELISVQCGHTVQRCALP
jgi:hypothetical protein